MPVASTGGRCHAADMQIACVLYERFTMLDIVGPFQVFSSLPGTTVEWVATEKGPVTDHTGFGQINATATFDEVTDPALVIVPGGIGTETLVPDHLVIPWLADVHQRTQWTTSVCTGSLLLAGAGLLTGKAATCHWLAMDQLRELGAEPTGQRVVIHEADRIVTSAGVSSGIDMGLSLVEHMFGSDMAATIQLAIEYDPQPPVDAGSPEKAAPEIQELVRASFAGM